MKITTSKTKPNKKGDSWSVRTVVTLESEGLDDELLKKLAPALCTAFKTLTIEIRGKDSYLVTTTRNFD